MRRANRLTSSGEIQAVYATGRRATRSAAGCVAIAQADPDAKIAVVAGRKVGGAVRRNRAKRRLRAALDPLVVRMTPGSRVVVGATTQTNKVSFEELTGDVEAVLTRVGALTSA